MEIRFLDIEALEFCPYTFALDVLLAGTTTTLHIFDDSLYSLTPESEW